MKERWHTTKPAVVIGYIYCQRGGMRQTFNQQRANRSINSVVPRGNGVLARLRRRAAGDRDVGLSDFDGRVYGAAADSDGTASALRAKHVSQPEMHTAGRSDALSKPASTVRPGNALPPSSIHCRYVAVRIRRRPSSDVRGQLNP